MPWEECSVMDERMRFIARLLEGETMTDMCQEFGISRKTGYKIFNRYKDQGSEALNDRSRRPVRNANQLPAQIEALIVSYKQEKPHWGARKIRELLVRRLRSDTRIPAKSTIHAVLHRHGLVKPPGRPRYRSTGTSMSPGTAPNDLWCVDFKGEFKLGNARYCYPLTVSDHVSRYLLLCEALESTREDTAITAFEQLFLDRGLPAAIRSDNGIPFASRSALFNLSKLSVWWLRLGIAIERIKPGLPELIYPLHDRDVVVTTCGRICIYQKKINLSTVMAGQRVGIKEVDEGIWLVSFMQYDLGYIDLEQKTLQPVDNPFGTRLLPMS